MLFVFYLLLGDPDMKRGFVFCLDASITEGPKAFAWLMNQIENKSDLPLGSVSGKCMLCQLLLKTVIFSLSFLLICLHYVQHSHSSGVVGHLSGVLNNECLSYCKKSLTLEWIY